MYWYEKYFKFYIGLCRGGCLKIILQSFLIEEKLHNLKPIEIFEILNKVLKYQGTKYLEINIKDIKNIQIRLS